MAPDSVQVQDYRLTNEPPVRTHPAERSGRELLIAAAGMTDLERSEGVLHDNFAIAAQVYDKEISSDQLKIWRDFLPTSYKLKAYTFDSPHDEVLAAISFAKELNCFDRIRIWTPEGGTLRARITGNIAEILDDPMAVGIIRGADGREHYYPIVRWGESLMSFEQIRRHVSSIRWQLRTIRLFSLLAVVCVVVGFVRFVTLPLAADPDYAAWKSFVLLVGTIVVFVGALFGSLGILLVTTTKVARRKGGKRPASS